MSDIEFFNKGLDLHKAGQYVEAIEWYDKALSINPNHANSLCCKGAALANLGRNEEAIEWFDKTLRINPNHDNTLGNKGLALMNLGRNEEAIECYDTVLSINANDAITLFNKGVALYNLGRHQEAIEWFDKALRINPNDTNALNNKGWTLYNLGRHEEAIEWYDKALKINPNDANALNNKKAAQDAMKSRIPKPSVASNSNVDDELSALNINSKNKNKRFDVFISYSWAQKKQARNLFYIFTQNGLSCWMDDNQLQAGDQLPQQLADAIYNSKLVIFCISRDYLNSPNCLREFDFSILHKKQFIPLLFCKDKRIEFKPWPSSHYVFFTMGNVIYVSNIFEHLDNSTSTNNTQIEDFIQQVKNKLN